LTDKTEKTGYDPLFAFVRVPGVGCWGIAGGGWFGCVESGSARGGFHVVGPVGFAWINGFETRVTDAIM